MDGHDLLRISVDRRAGDVVVVLAGEIDLSNSTEVAHQLRAEVQEADTNIVLDLKDLRFVDSSGIRSLLQAAKAATERGRPLTLRDPRPSVQRVLEIAGSASLIETSG